MEQREILERLQRGELDIDGAESALQRLLRERAEPLGFATIDHDRERRCGFPEVIYGAGKTPAQLVGIAERIVARGSRLLATRLSDEGAAALVQAIPGCQHHELARCVTRDAESAKDSQDPGGAEHGGQPGPIPIVAAGTSDLPVAEEARVTAEILGVRTEAIYDVGVAGLHRLLEHTDKLRAARCIVVVAGMEGALPSVVGGLVRCPVIAVPTSVGYGASFSGLAALLAMLNSCASGVSVVNIDNGFGAGYQAALIELSAQPAP